MGTKETAFVDLRLHFQTGRSFLLSGEGRNKTYGYRNGVQTNLGDIEISDWIHRVQSLIAEYDEGALHGDLLQWLREHNYTKDSEKELRFEALKLHAMRIFDDPEWVDYIPWNRRFRLGTLDESRFVWVETACCHKPGQVTREQINRAYQHTICCPHCGRFSEYIECPQRKENAHECE